MKIKLLTTCLLAGIPNAVPEGTVVESEDPISVNEYKALIGVGYAKETNEAADKPKITDDSYREGDSELVEVLEGNVGEVVELLPMFTRDQLVRLAQLESQAEKPRKGVLEAITAALEVE